MSKISHLETFVLRKAEKKLLQYRLQAQELRKSSEYLEHHPCIQRCLDKSVYWHGTGRYQYAYQGESRHQGGNVNELRDVLDSIIRCDGLIPHLDPWIDSGGKTVSLGRVRMYSRGFARLHHFEKDHLVYELGDVRYWAHLYIVLGIIWGCTSMQGAGALAKIFSRRSWYKDMQSWGSVVRNPRNGKMGFWNAVTGNALCSDIEANYPILIGVGKNAPEVVGAVPLTDVVEARTLKPVTLTAFTHIEVPLSKVRQTEELLKSKSISLPVLPMEFVDVYMSDLPLEVLAYS